jgi:hypothetical protein
MNERIKRFFVAQKFHNKTKKKSGIRQKSCQTRRFQQEIRLFKNFKNHINPTLFKITNLNPQFKHIKPKIKHNLFQNPYYRPKSRQQPAPHFSPLCLRQITWYFVGSLVIDCKASEVRFSFVTWAESKRCLASKLGFESSHVNLWGKLE